MKTFTRLTLTLTLVPFLYLACVRLVSQFIISTDSSTLFETVMSRVLSAPQIFLPHTEPCSAKVPRLGYNIRSSRIRPLASADPLNSDYRYLLAWFSILYGDQVSASSACGEAILLSAADPKAMLLRGWIEGRRNDHEKAYAAFDRAVMLDPRRAESLAQQGVYLHSVALLAKEPTKTLYHTLALLSIHNALNVNPLLYQDPHVNTALASLQKSFGQPGYAMAVLSRIRRDASFSWPTLIQRAALLFELGEDVKAISLWKSQFDSQETTPNDQAMIETEIKRYNTPELAYFLAQIYIRRGQFALAASQLKDLISKKNSVEYGIALASVQERMGNRSDAIRLYEEALRLAPANQEAKRRVMELYRNPTAR